ncbi:MAG: response regulator [bacterium]|nr:response regulator [bacterium]
MPSVILVEDDPMIGEIYQKKFSSAGFETTIVSSGKEFLDKAKEEKYDVALLDMVLPEMSGLDILEEIKKSGKYNPKMKVFIFSNLSGKESYDKAMQSGADGYISKTQYNPSELVNEIKRLLNGTQEREKNEEKQNGDSEKVSDSNENGKKRILFIEDENVFLDMFCKKLEDEGYIVEKAENGAGGLKEALSKSFDLIITDMVMPVMEGVDIIKRLRLEERTKNTPIIVLSASSTDEKIRETKELKISDFFVKTRVTPEDLARRVKELLK